ncbi:hypothetical protein [Mesorhizobium sp.]|uniref:hypothetical protein n=1 Tax=Mesorhizobium sp. TaxID=1871066 RepID=UPI000FE9DE16|nr:hypothetical protein [Mesorhizobium sp.]RWI13532.1 MAG: hypothetical protein EOQ92_30565 [Mesorhizobium sp.]RWK46573.1 MAG: hypothetical protein EOR47_25410 [Mesorhizobium sp.]RWK87655.1 MAG: hypothetical protein EOR53_34880 [Mesorhizobium sp.]TIP55029.1 MAG: hypothetical protein E5X56_30455 [Mesorhizobium sp.]TIQ25741.1 MAG: hypothetical protein E5X54_28880 [Mesorhizobium sp.]
MKDRENVGSGARNRSKLVDAETKGWDEKNIEPFLSMIHPDMAWPFAPNADAHDPIDWHFVMGRFDEEEWRRSYNGFFAAHDLIHNRRNTVKIEVAPTGDAAFAVVDIDTLWRNKETGLDFPWKGRVCKIYSKAPKRRMEILLADQRPQLPAKNLNRGPVGRRLESRVSAAAWRPIRTAGPCQRYQAQEYNPLLRRPFNGDRHASKDPRRHSGRPRNHLCQLCAPHVLQIDEARYTGAN